MKKVFKSALMIGFLSISASMMSKDKDFSVSFGETKAETVSFELSNAANVSVSVYNEIYGELFSETLDNKSAVSKSYNFKDLDEGTYYLVVESKQKIEKYRINVDFDKTVSIDEKPVSEIAKPQFTVDGNKVKLQISGLTRTVNVSVLDFENTVYYKAEKSGNNGELELTFDLNPNTSDNYIISVEENGKVFNRIVNLK